MEPHSEQWEVILFGPLHVSYGERSIERFPPGHTALLFSFLVTYPRRHLREELVNLLWPNTEADSESFRHRLSQIIWRTRQIVNDLCSVVGRDILITDRNTVGIAPGVVISDVTQYQKLLQQARSLPDGSPTQIEALEQAIDLYGDAGGFLPGFYDDWVLRERQRLLTENLSAISRLVRHYETGQQWDKALRLAERAIAIDPLVEESHQTLIRLLITSGQPAAAQRQYHDLTRLLSRELNTEPSAATRLLLKQIEQSPEIIPVPASISTSKRSIGALTPAPLPIPLTTFYGRTIILEELTALLNTPTSTIRLVTLLGTSGVGKTRLAVEFAHRVTAQSGTFTAAFVSLAEIKEQRLVGETIADAISLDRDGTPITRIAQALSPPTGSSSEPFLLVLDNAESLTEVVGVVVAELLTKIPRLRVLVTSQRPLSISGEQEMRLAPLELPDRRNMSSPAQTALESVPSIQLFINRAKSVRPDFPTDAVSITGVALICERLEGLPLAIELCAGWAQTLSVTQMWEMLTQRFELLVSRRADIPERHRTLRAAIEYSYLQLPHALQEFFIQLSVFRDGWTLPAVTSVCWDDSIPSTLNALAQMREHSLIIATEARIGDGMRYRMLESLRDFAAEQRTIAQSLQHRQAHATYFSRFVQDTVERLSGEEYALWSARIADELENIRAMLAYLHERGDIEETWKATIAVALCWNRHHNVYEARYWLEHALTISDSTRNDEPYLQLRAKLLYVYADALRILSDYPRAMAFAEQAMMIWQSLGDSRNTAKSLVVIGIAAMLNNDHDRAQAVLTEALSHARALNDDLLVASSLNTLAGVAIALQDWTNAREVLLESLYLYRKSNSIPNISFCLNNLGLVARYEGNYVSAEKLFREAVNLSGQDKSRLSGTLNLATVERLKSNYGESLHLLSSNMQAIIVYGEKRILAWCIKEMGHLAVALKLFPLGLRLLACAESTREAAGFSFKLLGPEDIIQDRALAYTALGDMEGEANWVLGMAAVPESLLAEAQSILTRQLEMEELGERL